MAYAPLSRQAPAPAPAGYPRQKATVPPRQRDLPRMSGPGKPGEQAQATGHAGSPAADNYVTYHVDSYVTYHLTC